MVQNLNNQSVYSKIFLSSSADSSVLFFCKQTSMTMRAPSNYWIPLYLTRVQNLLPFRCGGFLNNHWKHSQRGVIYKYVLIPRKRKEIEKQRIRNHFHKWLHNPLRASSGLYHFLSVRWIFFNCRFHLANTLLIVGYKKSFISLAKHSWE